MLKCCITGLELWFRGIYGYCCFSQADSGVPDPPPEYVAEPKEAFAGPKYLNSAPYPVWAAVAKYLRLAGLNNAS